MRRTSLQNFGICLSAFTLASCSYGYEVLAVVIGGRLAFVVDPKSDYQPDCLGSIHLSVDNGGPIARPAEGDDQGLVLNGGIYWWKSTAVTSCENDFPIFYGQQIKGLPFIYDDGPSSVDAKPLRVGVLYQVTTEGDGAYGYGWFRISAGGRIENFRDDPTPPVRDEQGYDITDYANMAEAPNLGTYTP